MKRAWIMTHGFHPRRQSFDESRFREGRALQNEERKHVCPSCSVMSIEGAPHDDMCRGTNASVMKRAWIMTQGFHPRPRVSLNLGFLEGGHYKMKRGNAYVHSV